MIHKYFGINIWSGKIKHYFQALININAWFSLIVQLYNKYGKYYVSVKKIPKFSGEDELVICEECVNSEKVAIVIQGPILKKDNFTMKSVMLYKKIFTDADIILSTWDNEKKEDIENFKKLGICVITSSLPKNMGCSNVNAQLTSTRAGVLAANEMGAEYILKIRTDWRINYPYAFNYLKILLEREKKYTGKEKIIVVDNYENRSFKLPPFVLPDFIYFGKAADMVNLATISENKCPYKNAREYMEVNHLSELPNWAEQCRHNIPPEYYITTTYLKKIGENGDFTDENYYKKCLREYFIIVSPWDIDLYWLKYKNVLNQPTSWVYGSKNTYLATYNMSYCDYIQYVSEKDKQEE